jgi:deoxyribodipyrimidine photolyase-like uncharacterized protein
MAVMYRTFDKMAPSKQSAIQESAQVFLDALK